MTRPGVRRLRQTRRYGTLALLLTFIVDLYTSDTIQLVLGLLFYLELLVVVVAVAILSWLRLFRKQPKDSAISEPKLHAVYHNALLRSQMSDLLFVQVVSVYGHHRRGTKAIVRHPEGQTQDAWFWHVRIEPGAVYLVRASTGYGPHTNRTGVLYIGEVFGQHGVMDTLPDACWSAGHRSQV